MTLYIVKLIMLLKCKREPDVQYEALTAGTQS